MRVIVGAIFLCWAAVAQPNWVQLSPSTSPPGREAQGMAYDGARHQIVIFGGAVATSPSNFTIGNDTWVWDGQTWHQESPATVPPARGRPCMIYDPRTQQIVMVGGESFSGQLSDTWVWDGTNWTHIDTSLTGQPRGDCYSSFGFDEAHQQAILLTGVSNTSLASGTWSWDGSAWTQLHPATNPPYLGMAQVAYDRARGELVLTTHTDNPNNNNFSSTWAWSGTDWVRKPPAGDHLPKDLNAGQAVYDPVHQRILIMLEGRRHGRGMARPGVCSIRRPARPIEFWRGLRSMK